MVFRWNAKTDRYESTSLRRDLAGLARYRDFLQGLLEEGEAESAVVRRQVVEFYRGGE